MLLLLLNVACYPEFPTTKGESFPENPWHDYDGDGYTEMSGDCDDEVPGIPAPVTYYLDGDNDTFGDASESYTACINMMPAGYVADGTDCNDTDPETYPGSSRDGAGLCVRDLDGDDYGDATATDPYDKGSDCNDDDALTYPGSSQEGSGLCVQDLDGDGYGGRNVALPYDQGSDCDDSDERTFPGSSREGGGLCVQDLDGDGYGDSQQPEGFDSGWDCNDADSTVFPGSSLEAGNLCVRDLDGDGYGDQAVELPYDAGTDCNDSHEDVHLGSAFLEPWLCALDVDNDGYGDAVPGNLAEAGRDCDDSDAGVYPGLNNEPGVICILDGDGDGYGEMNPSLPQYDSGTDCDDSDPQSNPLAYEVCDEVDNDCDGDVDEAGAFGGETWYVDSDGDGFGSLTAATLTTCDEEPAGYAAISLDCDDGDAASFPGSVEICDNADNDCDGQVDENVMSLFYTDSDGDGYGDATQVTLSCTAPSGSVALNTDCNDSDGGINPGATEIVADNIDQNCDGIERCYIDIDNDGYGDTTEVNSTTSSCLIGGFADNSTDCNDADSTQYPSAPELCNGEDEDCNGLIDDNPIGQLTWYLDADDDGDGDMTDANGDGVPDNYLIACPVYDPLPSAPVGYSEIAGDCDDSDDAISSLADEYCTDTIDENCDGNTTLGAMDAGQWYADSDADGFANEAYVMYACPNYDTAGNPIPPIGYVEVVIDSQGQELFDCDDTDGDLWPGNTELCNGKLDDCDQAEDSDGDGIVEYGPRAEERDDDSDGYIECDYTLETWTEITTIPNGWGDCQDDDSDVFPGAPELCTGEVEDCDSVDYGTVPADESDDDGDGYVECTGFISIAWEGSAGVVGGDDCDDTSIDSDGDGVLDGFYTYPGAAENIADPTFCASDADQDGDPDCVRWMNNNDQPSPAGYFCDYGVFITNTIGPDFVSIPAGIDPDNRYELSNDYYMMTTEITREMFEELMGYQPSHYSSSPLLQGSDYPVEDVSFYDAAAFANELSDSVGLDRCYNENNDYSPHSMYTGNNIYDCPGYRLPTEAEWDYAARSGVSGSAVNWYDSGYLWTEHGGGVISSGSSNLIVNDGYNTLLSEYVWYSGNNIPNGPKPVALLTPNGFGLYDMSGNVSEIVEDWLSSTNYQTHTFPNGSSSSVILDPIGQPAGVEKVTRGGRFWSSSNELGAEKMLSLDTLPGGQNNADSTTGFRLVRTVP